MTIFFRSRFFLSNFFENNISRLGFSKLILRQWRQHQKIFLKCSKRSGTDSSLLFLFSNWCGSAAIKI